MSTGYAYTADAEPAGHILTTMRKRWTVPILMIGLLAACTNSEDINDTLTVPPPGVVTTTSTTIAPPAGCAEPGLFTESGVVADIANPGSDASTIGLIQWEDVAAACERFTISFQSSEGAPAISPPSVRVEHLDGLPIVRITVGSNDSMVIDQLIESDLVQKLFVVSSLRENTFIDLHLNAPVWVRMITGQAPARIEIEMIPGIVDPTVRPNVSENLVVISPQEGVRSRVPILVTGYARGFDSGVLVMATSGANILYEQVLEPAQGPGWVEFRISLSLPPGPVLVFVGEDQPGPAGLAGVVIPMTVE